METHVADLPAVEKDFSNGLKTAKLVGCKEDDIFKSKDVTYRAIFDTLAEIVERIQAYQFMDEKVFLYIYAAGHGGEYTTKEGLYLIMNEKDPTKTLFPLESKVK